MKFFRNMFIKLGVLAVIVVTQMLICKLIGEIVFIFLYAFYAGIVGMTVSNKLCDKE